MRDYMLKVSHSDCFNYSIPIMCDSDDSAIAKAALRLGSDHDTITSVFLYRVSNFGPRATEELIGNFQFDHKEEKFIFLPA